MFLYMLIWIIYGLSVSDSKNALLIIDVQDCFLAGGSLEVTDGNDVIPIINNIRKSYGKYFDLVVFSKDWHCKDHVSFASQHSGYSPLQTINLSYNSNGELCIAGNINQTNKYAVPCTTVSKQIEQTLWPDHCIKNVSSGPASSKIDTSLIRKDSDIIVYKGQYCHIDAYSVFYDNGRITKTELDDILKNKDIENVYLTGLALDYCVFYSAVDSQYLGYNTYVVVDAARGVANETVTQAIETMKQKDIKLIVSDDLPIYLDVSRANNYMVTGLGKVAFILFSLIFLIK